MASQIVMQGIAPFGAAAHTATPTMGAIAIGLAATVLAAIALRSVIVAAKALAGLIIEGLKIVLIMLAAPLVLVLVLRSGHAVGAQSAGNHAGAGAATSVPH